MTRKQETLQNWLGARSELLPDPGSNSSEFDGGGVVFDRESDAAYASELFAAERFHGRRLLATDRDLLRDFPDATRRELGLTTLPMSESMCPGVTPPNFPVPDVEPATPRL